MKIFGLHILKENTLNDLIQRHRSEERKLTLSMGFGSMSEAKPEPDGEIAKNHHRIQKAIAGAKKR